MTREALRDYLSADPTLEVVGEAADGQVAIRQAAVLRPDVVLMDMQMPVLDGVAATAAIHAEHPEIRIIGLTTFSTDRYVTPLLRAGASGYLVKDTRPRDVLAAIHAALSGESVLSPEVTRHVVAGLRESVPAVTARDEAIASLFTDKELQVIELLARGLGNREMAESLHVAESTVKARLVKIAAKLGVHDRVQILVLAVVHGLVDLRG
ncbi:MAG: DNA-binding response regulator [Micrococcales bacterium 73-13]|nr:MAG: DNA-binding response regulator [Micrococcales bacterium 73-13]